MIIGLDSIRLICHTTSMKNISNDPVVVATRKEVEFALDACPNKKFSDCTDEEKELFYELEKRLQDHRNACKAAKLKN